MIEVSAKSTAEHIGLRVKTLRKASGFSLDILAEKSGVSRAAISLIERGQSSPTAVVLERLASGLGMTLVNLFEKGDLESNKDVSIAQAAKIIWWQDPASGYQRRNVSPAGAPVQIVESVFPAGASVQYESAERNTYFHEQIWVIEGVMHISLSGVVHVLNAGDCIAFSLGQTVGFHNPGPLSARYAVIIAKQ